MRMVGSGGRELVLLLALLGFGGASCIVRGSLKAPSESGTQWVELRSKHFRLTTDLDADDAQGVVRAFE